MLCNVVLLLAVLCSFIVEGEANGLQPFSSQWLEISGGARGGKKPARSGLSKARKQRQDDDEGDDGNGFDDEQFDITGKSKRSKSKQASKYQLVPWGRGSAKKRRGPTVMQRLGALGSGLTKVGQSAAKEVYRQAKVFRSSPFEGMLLKATWPDNTPVPSDLLTEVIKYAIPAFKYSSDEEDPYHLTMHKLWTKMAERDWRTVSKSIYILHCISRDSAAEACRRFAGEMRGMAKTRNPKKPDQKYFDLRQIASLDAAGEAYEPFVHGYSAYVLQRAKTFSGRFEEINAQTNLKKTVSTLLKAQQLMKLGVQVKVDKDQRNALTGQAIKLVALDLKELWSLCDQKIATLLTNGTQVEDKDLLSVLRGHRDSRQQVQAFLADAAQAFAKLKIKIPSDLSAGSKDKDSRLEEVLKLHGGAGARKVSAPIDDDEDDEEDAGDGCEDEECHECDSNEEGDEEEEEGNGDDEGEESDDEGEEEDEEEAEEEEDEEADDSDEEEGGDEEDDEDDE